MYFRKIHFDSLILLRVHRKGEEATLPIIMTTDMRYWIVMIVYRTLINLVFHVFLQEMRMEPMDDHEEDEMEMSDDERDRAMSPMKSNFGPPSSKRARMDNDSLKVREKKAFNYRRSQFLIPYTFFCRRRTTVSSASCKCTRTKWTW